MMTQSELQAIVYVIDDDASLREAMQRLLRSVGLRVEVFASTSEFIRSKPGDFPCCLVLDVRLPGSSGLDFQTELTKAHFDIPIIFMTGYGDIPMTVKALKAGAIEFLPKPFRDQDMLDAIRLGLEQDRARRLAQHDAADARSRFGSLTLREQQVMEWVTSGLMNKQIAGEMKLAEITVKTHRASVMRKMGAKSLPELVRMADVLELRKKS